MDMDDEITPNEPRADDGDDLPPADPERASDGEALAMFE
jgi:hypothetical protein